MEIFSTIVPIFTIVILGWAARKKGFMPPEFLGPANRLVFYIAIPAMIFRSISRGSLSTQFDAAVLLSTFSAITLSYVLAWFVCRTGKVRGKQAGTFIQSAAHGNLGYVGLAVAFYYLGDNGLVSASILAGFLMILQNLLSVIALQVYSPHNNGRPDIKAMTGKVLGNPVIISALAGILWSAMKLPLPLIVSRSLDILSGLSLPTALLIIGASISFEMIRSHFRRVTGAIAIKLLVLPALGILFFILMRVSTDDFTPGLILLASPTATITYVMGKEMHGDADFAAAAISASTALSAGSFTFWLMIARWL